MFYSINFFLSCILSGTKFINVSPSRKPRHHFVEIIIVTPTTGLSDLVIIKDLFRRIHGERWSVITWELEMRKYDNFNSKNIWILATHSKHAINVHKALLLQRKEWKRKMLERKKGRSER